jgi:hypothetical protein
MCNIDEDETISSHRLNGWNHNDLGSRFRLHGNIHDARHNYLFLRAHDDH